VFYAYLSSVFLLPSVIVVWERLATDEKTPIPLIDAVDGAIGGQQSSTSRE
jgi:hypothetical protein